MVLVLSACPPGLRGHLTRWLLEISAGVFVGNVSERVRTLMWEETTANLKHGRAILVYQTNSEQRLAFAVHGHHWKPVDFEGITLMLRPSDPAEQAHPERRGTSNASRWRRFNSS